MSRVVAFVLLAVSGCQVRVADGVLSCEPDQPDDCPPGFFCQKRAGLAGGEFRCYRSAGEICGNGWLGAGEECDGAFLDGATCRDLGYFGGELACSAACRLDDAGCVKLARLSAGSFHVCGLDDGGGAWCWGDNLYGALGDGGWLSSHRPVAVSGAHRFQALCAGKEFSCGVDGAGQGLCWGLNGYGQLGNGNAITQREPVKVKGGLHLKAVAAGRHHACALDDDGDAWCWGRNNVGQLGEGTTTTRLAPAQVGIKLEKLAVGGYHSCGLEGGKAWCWGLNRSGQLGTGKASAGSVVAVRAASGRLFDQLSAGLFHTCGLDRDGVVWCWGSNKSRQSNPGSIEANVLDPLRVSSTLRFTEVAAGETHTCAVERASGGQPGAVWCWGKGPKDSGLAPVASKRAFSTITAGNRFSCALDGGLVHCWGLNGAGQLGAPLGSTQPTRVIGAAHVKSIAAGEHSTCAVADDDAGSCWGQSELGQLGSLAALGAAEAAAIDGSHRWRELALGVEHACGIDDTGHAWCWGAGAAGQLGNGSTSAYYTPVAVSGGHTFQAIAAGGYQSCGLAQATAYCWGSGSQALPVEVVGRAFKQISTGWAHVCGVDTDRALWCWGQNPHGQLGDGTLSSRSSPILVAGGQRFATVAAGYRHTCALDVKGQAWCWGYNWAGALGNGAIVDHTRPFAVKGGRVFSAVAAGRDATCGLAAQGQAFCWGLNRSGQVGDGTRDNRFEPTAVAGSHAFRSLVHGGTHVCAVDEKGQAWCWGDNSEAQLGTVGFQDKPTLVPSP